MVFGAPNNYNGNAFTRPESELLNKQVIEKDNRPVNLNLLTISLPIIGLSSILHRISGLAVFFSFPLIVWVFSISLESENSFLMLSNLLQNLSLIHI